MKATFYSESISRPNELRQDGVLADEIKLGGVSGPSTQMNKNY